MKTKSVEIFETIKTPLPNIFKAIITSGNPTDYEGKPQTNWTTRKALYEALKQLVPDKKFYIKKLPDKTFEILHQYKHICMVQQKNKTTIEVSYE